MYGWIWRQIPGPLVVRLLLLLALIGGLIIICFQLVYPRISDFMPFNQQTVDDGSSHPPATAPPNSPTEAGTPTP